MGPGEEGGVREGGGREEGGSRREGPAVTTSFSYVQFAQRELCSAPQGASTGEKSQMPRNKKQFHNFCYAEIGSSNSISI